MPSYQLYSRIKCHMCLFSRSILAYHTKKSSTHTRNKIYTTMYTYTTTCYYHHTADGPKAKHSRAFVILLSFDPPRLGSYSKKIGQIFYDMTTTYTQNQDLWTYPTRPNPHSKPKNSSPLQKKKSDTRYKFLGRFSMQNS